MLGSVDTSVVCSIMVFGRYVDLDTGTASGLKASIGASEIPKGDRIITGHELPSQDRNFQEIAQAAVRSIWQGAIMGSPPYGPGSVSVHAAPSS